MSKRVALAVAGVVVIALVGALLVWRSSDGASVAVESFVNCPVEGCVAEAVSTASGQLWLEHEDISPDPISGAVGLQRTYSRNDSGSSSFGPGWRSIVDTRLEAGSGAQTLVGFPALPGAALEVDNNVVTFADGTRWAFDDDGSLVAITTRAGREFRIDRADRRITILDGKDVLFNITYNGDGRVERVSDRRPDGAGTFAYSYEAGRLVAVTSSSGAEIGDTYRYTYNPGGGLKRVIDSGGTTQITWADPRTVRQISVGGQVTTIQLPENSSDPTLVTLPGATKASEYRHDLKRRLVEVRQGRSVALHREYDTNGRLVMERDSNDERRFVWTDGRLGKVDSEANGVTDLEWDDGGRLTAMRRGASETTYEYEGSTWAPTRVTRDAATTTYRYRDGVLAEVTDPDGVTTQVDQGSGALLSSGAPPLSEIAARCAAGNDGLVLDEACRPAGISVTDAEGETIAEATVSYDDYGRTAATKGPNGNEEYTYDERGRIASVKRGDVEFTNEYSHDRLSRVTTDDGGVFAEYDYDDIGRLESLTSASGSARRSYDSSGRVQRIEDGGLVWDVTEYSPAGRPQSIDTPYGMVAITYDADGRVARTQVGQHNDRGGNKKITTDYSWASTDIGELATITRGGHVSSFTFDGGRMTTARTPMGHWRYTYDEDHPDHLARVSGPNGTTTYAYETDSSGSPRLVQMQRGDKTRRFEWDEFGRLTRDEGGDVDRVFRYRTDGITEEGSDGRKVTWDRSGLPARVESDGATEIWAWNQDRTLRSITVEGRGLPWPSDEQVWTARYDDRRLAGFDRRDSDDDVVVEWSDQMGAPAAPSVVTRGNEPELSLQWSEIGELERARTGDHEWRISRDEFRNVVAVERSGESEGKLVTTWRDGVPVGVSSGNDSMKVSECTEVDCTIALVVADRTTRIDYAEESITTTAGGTETVFARDDQGLITAGCQEVDDRQVCTEWLAEGRVGDRSELARFEGLLGGTDGQLRGLAYRPLPADPPALATLPNEFVPEGLRVQLPDDQLESALESAAPALPETYRLGADGAGARLAARLSSASVPVALGPGNAKSVAVLDDDGLAEFDSPFRDGAPIDVTTNALAGIEPDSVLRGVVDVANDYGIDVLSIVASVFTGGWAGAATLTVAAGACLAGSPSCAALAVTGALLLIPAIGPVALLLKGLLIQVVEAAVEVARGASWQNVGLATGTAMLVGLVTAKAPPIDKLCNLKRIWCLDAARSPEAAANAIEARGRRWGTLTVDRANSDARRADALRGVPPRAGLDRDEFPPAVTRQGGTGAGIRYVTPSDNRAAGASLAATTRHLDDGDRFLYLVVASRDRPLVDLDLAGAIPGLMPTDDR